MAGQRLTQPSCCSWRHTCPPDAFVPLTGVSFGRRQRRPHSQPAPGGEEESFCEERPGARHLRYSADLGPYLLASDQCDGSNAVGRDIHQPASLRGIIDSGGGGLTLINKNLIDHEIPADATWRESSFKCILSC